MNNSNFNHNNNNHNNHHGQDQWRKRLDEARPQRIGSQVGRSDVQLPTELRGAGQTKRRAEPPFMFAGIIASIVGSVFFSASILCVKLLPDDYDSMAEKMKAVAVRGAIIVITCGTTIWLQRSTFRVRRDELLVIASRSILGTLGVLGAYISLAYISMGDSTALTFSSPVWTSILSHFILGEPLRWILLLALPGSILGIILIAHPGLVVRDDLLAIGVGGAHRPSEPHHLHQHQQLESHNMFAHSADTTNQNNKFASNNSATIGPAPMAAMLTLTNSGPLVDEARLGNLTNYLTTAATTMAPNNNELLDNSVTHDDFEHRWPGIVIALGTSLAVSFIYIALKFRKSTPIQTTTFYLGLSNLIGALVAMCFTGFGELPSTLREYLLLLGCGLFSWLGQSILQWAFTFEDAGVLSIIRTFDVAMSFILSAMFLDDEILWTSIVGAGIISLVVVSLMLSNWISSKRSKNSTPKTSITTMGNSSSSDDQSTKIASKQINTISMGAKCYYDDGKSVAMMGGAGGGTFGRKSVYTVTKETSNMAA